MTLNPEQMLTASQLTPHVFHYIWQAFSPKAEPLIVDRSRPMLVPKKPSRTDIFSVTNPADSDTVYSGGSNPTVTAEK